MSVHQAFLDGIIEAPEDDTPRLIYADWLEENGDPDRAEFIRVQIRLAHTPPNAPHRARLVRREKALIRAHWRRWAEPLRGLRWGWRFNRGFIEAIQFDSLYREMVEPLRRIITSCPIRLLSVTGNLEEQEAVVETAPLLTQLQELRLEYTDFYAGSEHVRALLTSPHVAGLKKLYIVGGRNWTWLNKKALRAIITSPSLTGVTVFTLVHDWHGLANDLILTLARTPRKARLEQLSLYYSSIEPEVMRELVSSPQLARLTELDFRMCAWERPTWQALLEAPLLQNLQRLFLYNTEVTDAEGRYLADVGELVTGREMWRPDVALREALVNRFGASVVDFSTEDPDPPFWEGWQKWGKR